MILIVKTVFVCETCGKEDEPYSFENCFDCGRETCGWCGIKINNTKKCKLCTEKYFRERNQGLYQYD
jgi:hypothetical protein